MPRDFAGWKQTSPRKGTSKCPLITLVPLKDSGTLLTSGEGSFRSKMMEEGGQAYHSHPSLARKGVVQTLNHSKKKALEPFSLSPTPTNPSEVLLMLGPMKIPNLWVSSHLPTELPSVKLILRDSPQRDLLTVKGVLNSFQTTCLSSLPRPSLPGPTCLQIACGKEHFCTSLPGRTFAAQKPV